MDGVSENGGTVGQSLESGNPTVTPSSQEGDLMPETLRGSEWGFGRLIQSARSIRSRLGFSPLSPVSGSLESSPQTLVMGTAQVPTETAAPTLTKKESSSSISARDARAKNRRHNDSAIKPVKQTTASKNRTDNHHRPEKRAHNPTEPKQPC